jgi:pyruvate/2-oxoglutarate dehydrogenase complex dihydrolipoamide acyltransferase (E2) component
VLVDVPMPQMGTSITEGTVIGWAKAVGDVVAVDETICEISTDKVDSECPSPSAGVLAEILVEVGETVEVGTVLARIAAAGDAIATPAAAAPEPAAGARARSPQTDGRGSVSRRSSPVVARIVAAHGIDVDLVPGTGRNGRVTKRDVLAYVADHRGGSAAEAERPLHSESPYRPDPVAVAPTAGAPVAAPLDDGAGVTVQSLSRMRQSIGAAMLRSQQTTATCHTVVECDMSRVERRRRELGVTALPLIAGAVVETLREYPQLNATLDGTELTRYEAVHLGIAVSLGEDGLIVPVIRDAQDRSPEGLGRSIKDLATRARAKRLQPDEVRGATFTITNPGAFGAIIATPVIDVPQVAILDLEAIVRRPVVVTDADGQESIAIRSIGNLILGWDHRAIDGVYAAQFLAALRDRLQTL